MTDRNQDAALYNAITVVDEHIRKVKENAEAQKWRLVADKLKEIKVWIPAAGSKCSQLTPAAGHKLLTERVSRPLPSLESRHCQTYPRIDPESRRRDHRQDRSSTGQRGRDLAGWLDGYIWQFGNRQPQAECLDISYEVPGSRRAHSLDSGSWEEHSLRAEAVQTRGTYLEVEDELSQKQIILGQLVRRSGGSSSCRCQHHRSSILAFLLTLQR